MPPRFSTRTAWDTAEGPLAAATRHARASGRDLIDLTLSNPTLCGFRYDAPTLLAPLTDPAALLYDPDPRGILSARQAVAGYYASHGAQVPPDHVLLTTSTSEAYTHLFRLLCDPGDEVLVPQPSYPLFDFLADLADVRLRPYPIFEDFGWWIDFHALEQRITPRTRAILLVHPNNPTGHATSAQERTELLDLCARRGLPLIVDEVFLDFPLGSAPIPTFAASTPHPCLTFVLSGLSKIAALPQMKVGWLAAFGPQPTLSESLTRLEVIADTFLSLNAPAQLALPAWLRSREAIVPEILIRLRANLTTLQQAASSATFEVLPVEAGWSAVVRLARPIEGELADLIQEAGVLLHPGSFYALPGRNRAVLSLLGPTTPFTEATSRLTQWCRSAPSVPLLDV